jgi:hypothetical protein
MLADVRCDGSTDLQYVREKVHESGAFARDPPRRMR